MDKSTYDASEELVNGVILEVKEYLYGDSPYSRADILEMIFDAEKEMTSWRKEICQRN